MYAKKGRSKSATVVPVPPKEKLNQMMRDRQKKIEEKQKRMQNASAEAGKRKQFASELKPSHFLEVERSFVAEMDGSSEDPSGIDLVKGRLPSWIAIPLKRRSEAFEAETLESMERIKKIDRVKFSLVSDESILNRAQVVVDAGRVYERKTVKPRDNGVNDLRLGPLSRTTACNTCGNDIVDCLGHTGVAELPLPCYAPALIEKLHRSLCVLCFFCSALLLSESDRKLKKVLDTEKRWNDLAEGNLTFDGDPEEDLGPTRDSQPSDNARIRAVRFSRIVTVMDKMPKKRCPCCQAPQPKYVRKGLYLDTEWTKESLDWMSESESAHALKPFTPETARRILEGASEESARIMGIESATVLRATVWKNLEVMPPVIRPSMAVFEGASKRSNDYCTQKLVDVKKAAWELELAIKKEEDKTGKRFDPADPKTPQVWQEWTKLQLHVGLLIDGKCKMGKGFGPKSDLTEKHGGCNSDKTVADLMQQEAQKHQGKGKAQDPIRRLKGKGSRFRANLNGKRVNFSARLVIDPDPKIPIDEVLLPSYVALSLTYDETVYDANIAEMRKIVSIGFGKIGGARSVVLRDGTEYLLDATDSSSGADSHHIELAPGMIVRRYMRSGDVGVINRQPSLHKPSIQAVIVRIAHTPYRGCFNHPYPILSVIAMNPHLTKPFNADFDGDEMNFYFPQNEMARAECLVLLPVKANVKHPNANLCLSLIQDGIYGLWHLVRPDAFFDEEQVADLVSEIPSEAELTKNRIPTSRTCSLPEILRAKLPEPAVLKPKRLWTGKQVVSSLLPEGFDYDKMPRDSTSPAESPLVVEQCRAGKHPWILGRKVPESVSGKPDLEDLDRVGSILTDGLEGLDLSKLEQEHGKRTVRTALTFAWILKNRHETRASWFSWMEQAELNLMEQDRDRLPELVTEIWDQLATGKKTREGPMRNEDGLLVRNGEIILGEATGSLFGGSHGSVVHRLANDDRWGSDFAVNFMTRLQRVVARFLNWRSLTVSLGDTVPGKKSDEASSEAFVDRVMRAAKDVALRCRAEGIDPSCSEIEMLVSDMVGKTVYDGLSAKIKDLDRNNIFRIVKAGAKGNTINLVQILYCYGQITVEGRRNFSTDPRCGILPSFEPSDLDPEARAFVSRPLGKGLGPVELFSAFKGGREGLCDTSVKTSQIGYLFRKLFKAMEANQACWDRTVRNSNKQIVCPCYGDGNYDPRHLFKVGLSFLRSSDLELAKSMGLDLALCPEEDHRPYDPDKFEFLFEHDRSGSWALALECTDPDRCRVSCFERVRFFRDRLRISRMTHAFNRDLEDMALLPFDLNSEVRILSKKPPSGLPLSDQELVRRVRAFSERFRNRFYDALAVRACLEHGLTPDKLRQAKLDTDRGLAELFDKLWFLEERAKVEPGEMVGSLASQCIGEPATQMTLNTFHYAGLASKQVVTLTGIPWLQLSLDYSEEKQRLAAVCKVYLKAPFNRSEEACKEILQTIRCTKLRKLVKHDDVFVPGTEECKKSLRSRSDRVLYENDAKDLLGMPSNWTDESKPDGGNSVVVRLTLDREALEREGLVPKNVAEACESLFNGWPVESRYTDPERFQDKTLDWLVRLRVYDVVRFATSSKTSGSGSKKKWKSRDQAARMLKLNSQKANNADQPEEEAPEEESREEEPMETEDRTEALIKIGKTIACEMNKRIHVSGIRGIKGGHAVKIEYDALQESSGALVRRTEWMIETKRSVLKKIMGLACVDSARTYSTNAQEIETVFGIVSAKSSLVHAIKGALGSDSRVDDRHLETLVSTMTHLGYVVRVSRFGLNKLDTGTLTRATFEETIDTVCDAGLFGEVDPLREPTACLIAGQVAPMGGALIALLPDKAYVQKVARTIEDKKKALKVRVCKGLELELAPGIAWSARFERTVESQELADENEEKRKLRDAMDLSHGKAARKASQLTDSPVQSKKRKTSGPEPEAPGFSWL